MENIFETLGNILCPETAHKSKMKDLFETPELMPAELRAIIERWELRIMNGLSYSEIAKMLTEVESAGFTFDYYLDAEPYGLRPIGTPLSALEGFEKELTNETF